MKEEQEDGSYTRVDGIPVPKGFTHTEGTKETGFVIKNNTDGNEFVWIPTDLVEYKIYDWNKGCSSEEEYEIKYGESNPMYEMLESSIDKYKGYYIARYEAGILEKRTTYVPGEELVEPLFQATSD